MGPQNGQLTKVTFQLFPTFSQPAKVTLQFLPTSGQLAKVTCELFSTFCQLAKVTFLNLQRPAQVTLEPPGSNFPTFPNFRATCESNLRTFSNFRATYESYFHKVAAGPHATFPCKLMTCLGSFDGHCSTTKTGRGEYTDKESPNTNRGL